MSAYILPPQGFADLALELMDRPSSPHGNVQHIVDSYLGISRFVTRNERYTRIKQRCQALYNANVEAVNQRYNETNPIEPIDWHPFPEYGEHIPEWSLIQLIKHLRCLHYQMAEGDVCGSKIHRDLETFIAHLSRRALTSTKEYDQARWSWGWDEESNNTSGN